MWILRAGRKAAIAAMLMFGAGCHPMIAASPAMQQTPIVNDRAQSQSWEAVLQRAEAADVVLVGELHNHPRGLRLAADLFEALAQRSASLSLSFEFLERQHQPAVDAFLTTGDEAAFISATNFGKSFELGHGDMLRTARAQRRNIVAANAPRAYAKRARLEGYEALRTLPGPEQALFELPTMRPPPRYFEAFTKAMGGDGHSAGMDLEAFYRAQLLWDATMADSIAKERARGQRVLHVVGRFHVEHDGGLLHYLKNERAGTTFVLCMSETADNIAPGFADVVAIVGEP